MVGKVDTGRKLGRQLGFPTARAIGVATDGKKGIQSSFLKIVKLKK